MIWRESMREYGVSLGRQFYESTLGVGIEFQDGCDAYWILPGEEMSSVEFDPGRPMDEYLREYDRINEIRRDMLHVFVHHLVDQGVRVKRCRSSIWSTWNGLFSCKIPVGETLTRAALQSRTVSETITNWRGANWGSRPPSEELVEQYLQREGLPADPIVKEKKGREHDISDAPRWVGFCRVIKSPKFWVDAKRATSVAEQRDGIGQILRRLTERLSHSPASTDVTNPGVLSIGFKDGGASFDIDIRSRELLKRSQEETPEAVGDELADEFEKLESVRSTLFATVWQAASAMNWSVDRVGAPLFGIVPKVMLGKEKREVEFQVDNDLTARLQSQSPEGVLRELFSGHEAFRDACLSALHNPLSKVAEGDLPRANLPPRVMPEIVDLITVDESVFASMDQFASKVINEMFKIGNESLMSRYYEDEFYRADVDEWCPRSMWKELALRLDDKEWPYPPAIKMLLDDNDGRGDVAARAYVQQLTFATYGDCDQALELIWKYRHDYPEIGRTWLSPGSPDTYDQIRAKMGDPTAARRVQQIAAAEEARGIDEWNAGRVQKLPRDEQDAIHEELVAWARWEHRCSPPDVVKLRVAGQLGWTDVFDGLQENPFLVHGLLGSDDRDDDHDEPGLLIGSELLLVWSAYAPSEFLGRIVATARNTDLVSRAREAARRACEQNPKQAGGLHVAFIIYDSWAAELDKRLSIAWNRCRSFFDRSTSTSE